MKREEIRHLSQISQDGVAEVEQLRILLAKLQGLQILGLLGHKRLGGRLGKIVQLDGTRHTRASVTSHMGLYECVNVQVQRGRQIVRGLVTGKLLGLPVIQLDLVADGEQVHHDVASGLGGSPCTPTSGQRANICPPGQWVGNALGPYGIAKLHVGLIYKIDSAPSAHATSCELLPSHRWIRPPRRRRAETRAQGGLLILQHALQTCLGRSWGYRRLRRKSSHLFYD